MNILIIGAVAAGTKAAAKLKRYDHSANITLITESTDISYAGCGLPYYVGGDIADRDSLIVNTPEKFAALTDTTVFTGKRATAVDPKAKVVSAVDVKTLGTETYTYDKLIIATGASPVMPPIDGIDKRGVFTVRTPDDAVNIRSYIENENVRNAVVIGAGYIGLEMVSNLLERGIRTTVIDAADQVLPGAFDPEMAEYIKRSLTAKNVRVITQTAVDGILGDGKVSAVKATDVSINAELVIVAVGIRPNTDFLAGSGITLCDGKVAVDNTLKTNIDDIYAIGDCAMVSDRMTGKPKWSPMGSGANYEGRTLAGVLAGRGKSYPGTLGTGIVKLPDLNCARTGMSEAQARDEGYDVETVLAVNNDKPAYYPGSELIFTKLIADRKTHRLLGAQILGNGAVDKMTDLAVIGINASFTLEDYENADLAYAPPFSTAIHPFVQAVYILQNKLCGDMVSVTPAEYAAGKADDYRVIDASASPAIKGATYVDLTKVNGEVDGIAKDEKLLLVCNRGRRAYLLQKRLMAYGYTNTAVLEGSTLFNRVKVKAAKTTLTDEDITRVKALGFLRDKRTPDCFNCRVITRNGKITSEESRVIAEAASIYGSGEITMTSRLTLEIQGVPFDNIEPLCEYLDQRGLETGGTGSKVRPVVSCKGTTCQYGLIDTFELSEEIHERFYHGYRNVKLPHKFKIAVGGCPNNCVKPDLNDLGIIGQRVPDVDLAKCRGCKKCTVEALCPIKVAKMQDGKLTIDQNACNKCGRCADKCPFGAVTSHIDGYRIYIGGRWGKKVARGQALGKIYTDKEEVLDTVEKAILLFREQGITGERFADTIERIGFENVEAQLFDNALLERKTENITAEKHTKGGATC